MDFKQCLKNTPSQQDQPYHLNTYLLTCFTFTSAPRASVLFMQEEREEKGEGASMGHRVQQHAYKYNQHAM